MDLKMGMNVLSVTVKSLYVIELFGIVYFEIDSEELQKDSPVMNNYNKAFKKNKINQCQ